ncbi:MAG: nicotinamide mononucleotide transporter [Bacteroidaceae bacterium]|nr:nicotinamide mononucleotide transporter [Bacteroidaceae bacterium]
MALEVIGTIVGLVYLWLEYKASIYLWIASIIMPAIYIFVYYDAGLYADFGINIYYLGAAVYGWLVWRFGNKSKAQKELPITRMPMKSWLKVSMVYIVAQLLIAWILIEYTDSNVPWWDAFTTALSVVGMWMLARKYLEQWWEWIVVDVVCVGLYIYKELFFTAGLYAFYAIIAIFGWLNWKRLMNYQQI